MSKYDFDNIVDRRHTSSLKWDVDDNVLPMWVADMDFKAPDFIINELKDIASFGNFGYQNIPDEYFDSYISWWDKRHNVKFLKEDMIFSTGVVPAISSIVRKITTLGEKVVLLTPCYNIFFNSIVNNGRFVLESKLLYENNTYKIDFSDLENKLKDPQVSLMILCNPNNPTGNIWSKEDLELIGKLAYENNVIVLSDEIHCDIVENGYNYIPFSSVNDINKNNSITCISASKCFSLAGLQGACVVVHNKALRHKVWRGLNTDEVAEGNAFVARTFVKAFTKGENYIIELNDYIKKNKEYCYKFISDNIKELTVVNAHSLYLMWVDISRLTNDSSYFAKFLKDNANLLITEGISYGQSGEGFIRINLGTSFDNVKKGMELLKKGVELFKEKK